MPWVSAVTRLLDGSAATNVSSSANSSAASQNVWISFSHREGKYIISFRHNTARQLISHIQHSEPPFIVTALDLFNTTNASMPDTSINFSRAWRTSYILPFLANIALEKLTCSIATGTYNATTNQTTSSGVQTSDYVRAVVNSAPIPIEGCGASGPGGSCTLEAFGSYVSGAYTFACPVVVSYYWMDVD